MVFPSGTGGPPGGKNFARPPTDHRPHFLTRACPPPTEFCPQKFYLIFLSILTTF